MGVFDDKKFEQLDWMTQITETIESELNGLLARLPDRTEFDVKRILECVSPSARFTLQADSVVHSLCPKEDYKLMRSLSWEEDKMLCSCFQFEISPDFELNLEDRTMKGSLALVKVIPTLSDEAFIPIMGNRGIDAIRQLHFGDNPPLGRMDEMLDVLGKCEEARATKSFKKKRFRILERVREIFSTNEWRIRDTELANRVGEWIADYIATGNLAALTNFCKLKVMTHNHMPIYSIEEEK